MTDQHVDDQTLIDDAVNAYEEMMRHRAALGPAVEKANRLAHDLVDAHSPGFTAYLQRITEIDQRYGASTLPTQFDLVIGDVADQVLVPESRPPARHATATSNDRPGNSPVSGGDAAG